MKYVILDEIGRGAMGIVYRARDPVLDRVVALKCMQAALANDLDRARFDSEMNTLARLRHPRIVRLLDASSGTDAPYIAMELVPGKSLQFELGAGPMQPADAVKLLQGVLDGVGFLHQNRCWHGDLKPSNVILGDDGPVLIDFGLTQSLATTLDVTRSRHAAGTPSYIAPELLENPLPSEAADLFSVAVVGHECLLGHNLHWLDAATAPGLATILTSLQSGTYLRTAERQLASHGALGRVLLTALDPDPARRPVSAAAFSDALGEAVAVRFTAGRQTLAPEPARATATLAAPTPPRARSRMPRYLGVAVATAAITGITWSRIPRAVPSPAPTPSASAAVSPALLDATLERAEALVDGRDQAVFTTLVEANEGPEAPAARAALNAMLEEAKLRHEQIDELATRATSEAAPTPDAQVRLARVAVGRWRLWHAVQRAAHLDFFRFAGGPSGDRFATLLDDPAGQYPQEGIAIEERALRAVADALAALATRPRESGPHLGTLLHGLKDLSYRSGFFLWPPEHRERSKRVRARFVQDLKDLKGEQAPALARTANRLWEAYQPNVRRPLKPGELRPDLEILAQAMPDAAPGLKALAARLDRR